MKASATLNPIPLDAPVMTAVFVAIIFSFFGHDRPNWGFMMSKNRCTVPGLDVIAIYLSLKNSGSSKSV